MSNTDETGVRIQTGDELMEALKEILDRRTSTSEMIDIAKQLGFTDEEYISSAHRLDQAVKSLLRPAIDTIELVVRIEDELTSIAPHSREHQIYVERAAKAIDYVNAAVGEIDDWLSGLRSVEERKRREERADKLSDLRREMHR